MKDKKDGHKNELSTMNFVLSQGLCSYLMFHTERVQTYYEGSNRKEWSKNQDALNL